MRKFLVSSLLSLMLAPGLAAAADNCATTIEADDAMKFSKSEIVVPKSCQQFTVTLRHVGKMPVSAMGHNWVLTKEADMQSVATAGIQAGLDKNYLPPNDQRVIAATKMIGGGEEASVTFDVANLTPGEPYTFFCSFPGHWAIMKGTVKLAD